MLFDQTNNNNKKTRQAVISKIGTIRIYDCNFILDSGSSIHFARLNNIVPGTFGRNKIKYWDVTGTNIYSSIGEATVQLNCIDENNKMHSITLNDIAITRDGI